MKKTATAIAQLGSLLVVWSNRLRQIRSRRGTDVNMNAQHPDYSLALGVFSAAIGLCVILMVWYAAKALWKTQRRAYLERQWRKAKGF
jgi:hypothetical protein